MDKLKFIEPLIEFHNSQIIDVSTGLEYTYNDIYKKAYFISKSLLMNNITKGSIVVIYKMNNIFDTILVFFACLINNLIPFIVDNEDLCNLSDLKFKVVVTNYKLSLSLPSSHLIEDSSLNISLHNLDIDDYYIGEENDFTIVTSSRSTSSISKKILLGANGTLFNINSNKTSLPISKKEKTLILLPLSYSYGLIAQFFTHLFVGADIIIAPKTIGIIQLKSIIQKYNVTNIFLTPLLARLIHIYNRNMTCDDIRYITLGGDKPSQSTIDGLKNIFNCEIYCTYGLAEAGPRVATSKLDNNKKFQNLDLGNVNSGIEIEILTSEKYRKLTDIDSVGYLKVITPSVFLGYVRGNFLDKPESSDFLITKDIVYSSNNNFYLLGRDNEYIILNSKLYWFQSLKSFFYEDPNVLKVLIKKNVDDLLLFTIFYKSTKGSQFNLESSFDSYFGIKKDLNYRLDVVEYQNNYYK